MIKSGVLVAAVLAVSMFVPAGTSPAEALTVVKPAVKEGSIKHEVGRRGFRGFRRGGFRGFRRGFRRGRIGGIRIRIGRGFRGRRFYGGYYPRRRFYRPRFYGTPYVSYRRYSRGGRCWRLRRTAVITGKSKWWRRYHRCRNGYYGW